MFESLPSFLFRRYPQGAGRALLVLGFLTALLWAGALPAQAGKGGVPGAPDAASDHGNQGKGQQGQGADAVAETTDAVVDSLGSEAAPPPPVAVLEAGSPDGGANSTLGPYDPDPADPGASGVGEPSGNGKSTDNNGNRPCAGCVGKADYKNPPGQLPDGTDHNKGYECDENEGVGKMNPAHSGCAPGAPTPPNQPPPSISPPTSAVTPPAESPPESKPPEARAEEGGKVQGVQERQEVPATPPEVPVPAALPVSAVVTAPSEKLEELPLTGGQPLFLGLLGLLTLVAGLGLARLLRRHAHA
jgi:hypothetical protein